MTEHERDQRDLAMIAEYEAGAVKDYIVAVYGVTKVYLTRLLNEVTRQ
jgi:hypothetical protein